MWSPKRVIGNRGEDFAAEFLMKQGFFVLARNYLKKCGEIDIIAKKQGIYHFVEVKTVTREMGNKSEFRAEDNLHRYKFERLAKTIQIYIAEKGIWNADWQIDAIIVILSPDGTLQKLEYLDNINL